MSNTTWDRDDTFIKGHNGDDGYGDPVGVQITSETDGAKERLHVEAKINDEHPIAVVSGEHENIHDGKHFTYSEVFTLDGGNSKYFAIEVGDGDSVLHVQWRLTIQEDCRIWLYENPTYTRGTLITTKNNNRNYNTTLINSAFYNASVVSGGTIIYTENIPAKSNIPSGTKRDNEFVLGRNKKYILHILSGSNGNIHSLEMFGYESMEGNNL